MSAAEKINQRIKELGDWRGEMLAQVRKLIHDAILTSRKNGSGWGHRIFARRDRVHGRVL